MNAKEYVEKEEAKHGVEPRPVQANSGQGRIEELKTLFEEFAKKEYEEFGAIYLEDISEDFRDYFYNVKDKELEELFINLDEETFEQWRDELYEKWDKEGGD